MKNYLILYTKQTRKKSSVSCLTQGSEMSNFCLKQGQGLKASAAQLYPDFPWVPPGLRAPIGFFNESFRPLFNPQSLPPFCLEIPNPGLQRRQIPKIFIHVYCLYQWNKLKTGNLIEAQRLYAVAKPNHSFNYPWKKRKKWRTNTDFNMQVDTRVWKVTD